jgi:hypothetical protein
MRINSSKLDMKMSSKPKDRLYVVQNTLEGGAA